jgi:predicted nucleic acid-binding protein
VSYLIDTNVISELRKGRRCNRHVADWFAAVPADDIFLSVLTIGELRKGVEVIRRQDEKSASTLEHWVRATVRNYRERILAVDQAVAEEWGLMNVPQPLPVIDSLLAATAKVHGLTFATRNTDDVIRTGVHVFNPFAA